MSLQDKSYTRTAAELENKYGLQRLAKLNSNMETNNKELINIQNELIEIQNTLIINLRDILDSQSDISLWFYPNIPTTSNEPYISWLNPSEHIGDIYYSQDYGYVYKYTNDGWIQQNDENLINAMALTNAEIDTTIDHERKVFLVKPTPPYESGDWWIQNNGELKICQLGRITGEFDEQDFIVGNKYVPTIATQDGDLITIKQGQVIKMSDTFATFTDLATGGSTTINGANITTGTINTNNVSIGNNNVRIDADGMKLSNGAKIVGGDGLISSMIIESNIKSYTFVGGSVMLPMGYSQIGQSSFSKDCLEFNFTIPKEFTPLSAFIVLEHVPAVHYYYDPQTYIKTSKTGWCRNLGLYKSNNFQYGKFVVDYEFGSLSENDMNYIEIPGAFGSSGFTGNNSSYINKKSEIELVNYINSSNIEDKFNVWKIETRNGLVSNINDMYLQSGAVKATLTIIGRTKFNES